MASVEAQRELQTDGWKESFLSEVRDSEGYIVLDPLHQDCETMIRANPEDPCKLQILVPNGRESPIWYEIDVECAAKNRLRWLGRARGLQISG